MKKTIKGFILGVIFTTLLMNTVFGVQVKKTIEVIYNSVNLTVNGTKINADNILYEGTTYVPLRAVADALGKDVGWDQETYTATINDKKKIDITYDTGNLQQANNLDSFNILANYLIANGTYDSLENTFYIQMETSSATYFIDYDKSTGYITFGQENNKGPAYMAIEIKDISSTYPYYFSFPDNNIKAGGNIIPSTINVNSTLTFDLYTGTMSDRSTYEDLSKLLICDTIEATEYIFRSNSLPVSINDFGFTKLYNGYNK